LEREVNGESGRYRKFAMDGFWDNVELAVRMPSLIK
jgi:hypothetical protein